MSIFEFKDDLKDMPPEFISELELAIKESYEEEGMSHQGFMKEIKLWLTNQK